MRRRNLQFWRVTFPSSCCVSEIFSYFQASLKIKWETRTMERRYKKKRMKKLGRHTRLKKAAYIDDKANYIFNCRMISNEPPSLQILK
jgi:hypothetical protein